MDVSIFTECLRYEPDSGKLFWLERPPKTFVSGKISAQSICKMWNGKWSGREAFTSKDTYGYRCGKIGSSSFLAHRVIWAMEFGLWPAHEVDHVNGIRDDNRLSNLRAATKQQNNFNKGVSSRNTSGAKGVFWAADRKKWRTQIRALGVTRYLGSFSSFSDAKSAYDAASVDMHGAFSRTFS